MSYAGEYVTVLSGHKVAKVNTLPENIVEVTTDKGEINQAHALLIATGSIRRRLDIPGADTYEHKGLTYCASCDGPMFADQDVAVIGGGNAGFETAAQLLAYAKSVTLISNNDFKADKITVKHVLGHEHMTGIAHARPIEIHGEQFVTGLTYETNAGEKKTLAVGGIFVEVGMIPATDFMDKVVDRDNHGRITIDPWTQQTSTPGIWAAGDCTNIKYHQNNISAGDGVRALEDIYVWLKTKH
jgi:alkyl hydroperoxide reductase subunit AhpF